MKKIFVCLLLAICCLSLVGCKNNTTQDKIENQTEEYDKKLVQCLENELGGYLVTELDDLIEIRLSEIKSDTEHIAYYKGVHASEHTDNMYAIIVEKNKVFDTYVMRDFDKYFSQKHFIYQTYEISSEGISIYIHSASNDIDFRSITKKCSSNNNITLKEKSFPTKTSSKLNDTKKVVIKLGQKELGTINDPDKITEVLNTISSSKQYGDYFFCDGHIFNFEMYKNNNKLIDTIYIWGDGRRLLPKSIHNGGCAYYSISNDMDLRRIIEEETDYIFYYILDVRESSNQNQQLIYEDNEHAYYLNGGNAEGILIKFVINNQIMTLKYALENKYISVEKLANDYPDILIKE